MKNNESDVFSFLITNKDFRDWVLDPNDERSYYWKKWMNEHPEAINEVKKAREFIERMTFKKEQLSHEEENELLEKIIANKKPAFESKYSKRRKTLFAIDQWVRVAAILVICFMSAIFIESFFHEIQLEPVVVAVEWKTVENPKGIKSKVTLPDGTMVMLNSASEIRYPKVFSDSQRVVELKGEAFFEVVRNEHKPFIIHSERITTEVLGTSFNIKAYHFGEDQHIAVVSGRVKVSNTEGDTEILNPNEMGLIGSDNLIDKTSFDLKHITGWKDGIISFKRASFTDIQEQLSIWYDVDFEIEEGFKMENVYTGEFHNETLENVMEGIAYSSGFTYSISDNKVLINK
ncbi:FecR family protein [Catalinimonas niigatensis]|uniref:FecR family protein n=1 Tax=Catalinimonas niigatensis TaxID=1397264 RepID=UPI00266710DB|nr:FecR family protein [Catalinimonas niigatensis]WPP49184.1 FecR domain-containing protein [Catalinimonas niigatensis]